MDFILYALYLILGILLGILTGITPGLHFNNVAIIVLSISSLFTIDPLYFAITVTAMMITHTFADFIPSTFLGAPDEDTSLSTLPMHRMLLKGEGYHAIYLSTYGSLLAFLYSLPLIPLFFLLLVHLNLAKFFPQYIPLLLLAIILHMWYMESLKNLRSMLFAIIIFFLSGFFGIIALNFPFNHNFMPFKLFSPNPLFPIFTGLFGIPVLLLSKNSSIPPQKLKIPKMDRRKYLASFVGTFSGSLVGFLPGVTSGIATVIARSFHKGKEEDFIVSLGSVNTSNYIFNLLSLFLILRPRSFAVKTIQNLIFIEKWSSFSFPPSNFLILLLTCGFTVLISFFLTLLLGKIFAIYLGSLGRNYGYLNLIILGIVLLFIFLFGGAIALLLAFVATLIGLLPPKFGVMRTHLMGVLILPTLLHYLS